jgi:hypothetical protein
VDLLRELDPVLLVGLQRPAEHVGLGLDGGLLAEVRHLVQALLELRGALLLLLRAPVESPLRPPASARGAAEAAPARPRGGAPDPPPRQAGVEASISLVMSRILRSRSCSSRSEPMVDVVIRPSVPVPVRVWRANPAAPRSSAPGVPAGAAASRWPPGPWSPRPGAASSSCISASRRASKLRSRSRAMAASNTRCVCSSSSGSP